VTTIRDDSGGPRFRVAVGGLLVVLAAIAVYANSLTGPFVFDDVAAIKENPSIAQLWPLWSVLQPPSHLTVSARPVANLTLAINHAIDGVRPQGYHALNLLIHAGAGLVLFGVIGRTLRKPALAPRFGAAAELLALTVAVLWVVHPLQTEAVTYVVQRVESLMGLFYLLTLYCYIRGTEAGASAWWLVLAVAACALGMATKEVMVSAPLLVLLHDRTFVAGSFAEAWRRRRTFYRSLAATWILLAWLVIGAENRSGSAGFGGGVSPWHYALTQCQAIVHYLWLCAWPHPLVFDYGTRLVRDPLAVVPQALLLLSLVAAAGWAVWRRPALGFPGVWFFAILAPSSSLVPVVTQSMAEHRMYLSLAAVLSLVVLASYVRLGRRSLFVWLVVAVGWGGLTMRRNRDYRTEAGLWRDTIAKCPDNPRAHNALGNVLADANRLDAAVDAFRRAGECDPAYAESRNNLGVVLHKLNRRDEASRAFAEALALNPGYAAAHYNLANLLDEDGRRDEARRHYLRVLELTPDEPATLVRLAELEVRSGDVFAAEKHYKAALEHAPAGTANATRFSLGYLLVTQGRWSEALDVLREAVRADPTSAIAHYNLANALVQSDRLADAVDEYARAVQLDPQMVPARFNLGNTLALLRRFPEAVRQFERVLALEPRHPRAQIALDEARRQSVLSPEAAGHGP